ncbi:hypothetical protein P886_4363 [Alteromonadaceae bacterium 2753L.S.0a.02]|nr:hypothetical protein P886_4363 [Alteromonadaceae bacterium 2753L.S.0a.02]
METNIVKPWYREPWAWLIVGPLVFVVILGIALVVISVKYRDDVVSDDYYQEGKMLDNRFEAERAARETGLHGDLQIDAGASEIRLILNQPLDSEETITLLLSHPIKSAKDHTYVLKRFSLTGYKASLDSPLSERWYVRVEAHTGDDPKAIWRLSGEADFRKAATFALQ